MTNIIHSSGDVQENTPYTSNDELNACGLTDWRIATDDEVSAYNAAHAEEIKEVKIINLQMQIEELDKKSIRALREGGIKDEATGQTWIEYYTAQIVALRMQIAGL